MSPEAVTSVAVVERRRKVTDRSALTSGESSLAELSAVAGVKVTVGSGLISGESCIVGVGDAAGVVEEDVGLV
jgi:hypothetical protein